MKWTVARDTDQVSDKYGVSAIPHLVVIDVEGYKRHDHVGLTGESTLRQEIDSLLSGNGNGDSNAGHHGPPYTLIAAIVVGIIVFLVIGIVVAGKILGWSEAPKKRHPRKR